MDDAAHRFELDCRVFVELVTGYLDDVLDADTTQAFDRHLLACPDCTEYLAQIRATIAATGRLTREAVDVHTMASLVLAFRELLTPPSPPVPPSPRRPVPSWPPRRPPPSRRTSP